MTEFKKEEEVGKDEEQKGEEGTRLAHLDTRFHSFHRVSYRGQQGHLN